MNRDVQDLAAKIRAWEMDAGESFTDYYMDDRVKEVSWAFWLLGKGFTEKANYLIDKIQAREYIDQCDKFHIHYNDDMSWADWDETEAVYFKDFLLWAEFLTASDRYWKDICEWFKEQGEENDNC